MEVKDIDIEDHKIQDAEDTYSIMRKIFFERHQEADFLKEHFWTIALNRALKIVAIELVSIGNNGSTIATPQEILRIPLYKGASQLVLVHNHPSGNLKPSTRDLDITNRLIQAALLMDIDIVDHVIVTEKSYYSFCDNDLIEKLRWDNKYALTFIREKQIKKEIEKSTKRVALSMLIEGIDPKKVAKVTGLTPQYIGKLAKEIEAKKNK